MSDKHDLQQLVEAYCEDPTPGLRNAIITNAMPLVRSIVGKVNRPDTPLSQFEDLESAGVMGLLQALDGYDPEQKVKFNTFAYYRIRGNVIDYLRKIDKMPRVKRATYGKAQQVMERLSQELGREATDEEIASELDISLDDYYKLLMSVQQRSVLSLDYTMYDEESGREMSDMIEDQEIERPDAGLDRDSMQQKLKAHIKQLKDRDRLVLALYYYEDLTLSEIAQLLDLTEARISQIVGKLLLQLRSSMQQTTA
jgi:RNA polymerase sigma factor for flagellar operon FliA